MKRVPPFVFCAGIIKQLMAAATNDRVTKGIIALLLIFYIYYLIKYNKNRHGKDWNNNLILAAAGTLVALVGAGLMCTEQYHTWGSLLLGAGLLCGIVGFSSSDGG